MQLEKVYEPQRFEPRWAEWWIERSLYAAPAGRKPDRDVFSLVIPPPNVTGMLHIGHMLEHSEIDVTTRWHRMRGDQTLWLPGTDHAGIATQMVVERSLREAGLSRHDIGREKFVERVWAWKEQYGSTILNQMKRTGTSVDWTRCRFTLDEGLSRAVREAFVRLYEKGLLYRGEYMVNWCPSCHTALSDLEVVHEETQGNLWHIKYPVKDLPGRFLTVATTRPETMLGDTAVAINPADPRYLDLHGKTVILPLMDREIPIILDELADPKFGTGVVKVTPAHDPNDFEAGKRHNLPLIKVIDLNAVMTAEAGPYAGLDRYEARKKVLADLEEIQLLAKTEPYMVSVGKCQRCKTVVEPLVSMQWFCRMKPLAEPAIKAVEDGRIQFVPENWTKTYNEWMYNIRDWCVSRQLWWGHRIPAWHCADCGAITVSRQDPTSCGTCGRTNITQDTDVLDTWFSSGLWPFSTLGWPDQTEDLKTYYPTTLLITGFDIIFFWVARMIMFGMEMMGDVPFRTVYIHGLVRDAERQKMSKTKGNTIDPLIVTDQYGTDAVRFSLLRGAAPGTDIVLSEERMASSRAFANKIWNAARFIFMQMEKAGLDAYNHPALSSTIDAPESIDGAVPLEDRWIFSRLNDCAARLDHAHKTYRFHEVADLLYGFFWDEFCDWYLELKKLRIEGPQSQAHVRNLLRVFEFALRLLHPVMPFLTEELWQRLKGDNPWPESISIAAFPQAGAGAADEAAEREMALLQEMITSARALRADQKLDPKQQLEGTLVTRGPAADVARREQRALELLTNTKFSVDGTGQTTGGRQTQYFDLFLEVPAGQADALKQRLDKEIEQLSKVIASSHRQLQDEKFMSRAPAKVVDGLKLKLADYEAQLAKSQDQLRQLGGG
jgi:valyl-tRNA synthetase